MTTLSKKGFGLGQGNYALLGLAIAALTVGLRLYKLDFKSLWIDELYSVVPTNPANSIAFIINYCKSDQPPFYFLLLHYWFKIFPYTSLSARLFSAVIGMAGVGAMYFLGKEIKSRQVGIFAAFLASINYFLIYYSQECRFYSLLFLMTVLSFIFFIRSLRQQNYRSYALYVISTIALLYTQYFGILVFVIQGFIFLIFVLWYKEKLSFILMGAVLGILIGCAFIPWLPTLLGDSDITSYWIESPKFYFIAVYYYLYFGRDWVTSILLLIIMMPFLKYFISVVRGRTEKRDEFFIGILLLTWIVLSYAIPYFRSIFSTPVLIPRYTIITLPAVLILIALGWEKITNPQIRSVLITFILVSVFANLFVIRGHYTTIDKSQLREAASLVIEKHQPGVKVYSNLEWWYNFYFYSTVPRIYVVGKYPANEAVELAPFVSEVQNEKQFWVLSGSGVSGLSGLQQDFVDREFFKKEEYSFFQASAILYEKNPH